MILPVLIGTFCAMGVFAGALYFHDRRRGGKCDGSCGSCDSYRSCGNKEKFERRKGSAGRRLHP